MATLSVGQPVKVYDGIYYGHDGLTRRVFNGTVMKAGRKLVTISWGPGWAERAVFRIDTGYENCSSDKRLFAPLEQTNTDARITAAKVALLDADVQIGDRSQLTTPQIEELAAIVKNMLPSEKPAGPESKIKSSE